MSLDRPGAAAGTSTADEAKGLGWMAACALVYAISAMIASVANLVTLAVAASHPGVGAVLAAISIGALLGLVGWLMALPALVLLALGLYELGRSGADPRKEVRLRWIVLVAGIGLFLVSVPVVVLAVGARTADATLVLLQTALGLASSMVLLYAATLPALRRIGPGWRESARIALLVGVVAAVVEAVAAIVMLTVPGAPLLANWPPLAWGFPASFVVLASAVLLWWAYGSLVKAAKTRSAAPEPGRFSGGP